MHITMAMVVALSLIFFVAFICSGNKEITIEIVSFNRNVAAIFIALYSIFNNIIFNKSFVAHTNTLAHTCAAAAHERKKPQLHSMKWNQVYKQS